MKNFQTKTKLLSTLIFLCITFSYSIGQVENPNDIEEFSYEYAAPSVGLATGAGTKSGSVNKTMKLYLIFENCSGYNTQANLNDIISNLNNVFGQINLNFSLLGTENTSAAGSKQSYAYWPYTNNIPPANFHPAMVIVFKNTNAPGSAQVGYPICDIGALWYFSKGESGRCNVLAHEVGHCFGLMHLRHGTMYNFNCDSVIRGEIDTSECRVKRFFYNYDQIPELVDGSNGYTAGDFCKDTEANPHYYYHPDTHVQLTDANGDYYETITQGKVMKYVTSDYYQFTSDQKKIMHNFLDNTIFNRTFEKIIVCSDVSQGDNVTATLVDEAPTTFISKSWSITNNTGCASINSSTGAISVTGSVNGTETVTCTIIQKKLYQHSFTFSHTVTKNITINPNPPAPTTSLPYNTETYYYDAEPLDVDVLYRFIMTNCGSSSSNYDYEWTSNGASDFIFKDINGNVVSDGNTAYGKTAYIECFEDDEITLSARYRENSSSLWSDWYDQNLTFEAEEMMMMMAPNPISLSLESSSIIQLVSTNESLQINYDLGWEMEIYDVNFTKKVKQIVKKKEFKLKTQGWKSGTYLVKAKYNNKTITGKLLLQD